MTTAAVATSAEPRYVVPVLTLLDPAGKLDIVANHAYARGAALTWIDRFLVPASSATAKPSPNRTGAVAGGLARLSAGRPVDLVCLDCG